MQKKTDMKKYLLILSTLLLTLTNGHSQTPFQVIDFETIAPNLTIDTSLIGNIWQIGIPNKTFFNQAYSIPNVIVTDTVNYYPINNHSDFTIVINNPFWFGNGGGSPSTMSFWSKYDTDLGKDGGYIDVSYNGGSTWANVIQDSIMFDTTFTFENNPFLPGTINFYSDTNTILNGTPAFSGNSGGWVYSEIYWVFCMAIKKSLPDSVMFRFHFVSDSIQNNKEGWMIDNISFTSGACIGGVNENNLPSSFSICPNPFYSETTIQTNKIIKDATLTVYNSIGQQVKQIRNISGQTFTLHRDNLQSGLYFLQLTQENKIIATEKLVISD